MSPHRPMTLAAMRNYMAKPSSRYRLMNRRFFADAWVGGSCATSYEKPTDILQDNGYRIVVHYDKFQNVTSVENIAPFLTLDEEKLDFVAVRSFTSFVFPAGKLVILPAAEILGDATPQVSRLATSLGSRRGLLKQRTQIDFTELADGDLVCIWNTAWRDLSGSRMRLRKAVRMRRSHAFQTRL